MVQSAYPLKIQEWLKDTRAGDKWEGEKMEVTGNGKKVDEEKL